MSPSNFKGIKVEPRSRRLSGGRSADRACAERSQTMAALQVRKLARHEHVSPAVLNRLQRAQEIQYLLLLRCA